MLFHSEGERLSTWLDAPWTGEYEAAREAALLVWSEQQSLERQVQGQVNREKHALELTYARQVLLDYPPFVKAAKIMKTSWSVLEDLAESKSEALKLEHLSLERLVRQVTTELRYGVE